MDAHKSPLLSVSQLPRELLAASVLTASLGFALHMASLKELVLDLLDLDYPHPWPIGEGLGFETVFGERVQQRPPEDGQTRRPIGGGPDCAGLRNRDHRSPGLASVIDANLDPAEQERRERPLRAVAVLGDRQLAVGYLAGLRVDVSHDRQHEIRIGPPR